MLKNNDNNYIKAYKRHIILMAIMKIITDTCKTHIKIMTIMTLITETHI